MTEQLSLPTFDPRAFPSISTASGFAAATLTTAARTFAPVSQQSSAVGSEALHLASRRFAAWSEHQKNLQACKQPMDVIAASQVFWQRAAADYTAFNQAIFNSWMGGFNAMAATAKAAIPANVRDVLPIRDLAPDAPIVETDPRRVEARRNVAA